MSLVAFVVVLAVVAVTFGVGGVLLVRRLAGRTGYVPEHDDLLGASYAAAGTGSRSCSPSSSS